MKLFINSETGNQVYLDFEPGQEHIAMDTLSGYLTVGLINKTELQQKTAVLQIQAKKYLGIK